MVKNMYSRYKTRGFYLLLASIAVFFSSCVDYENSLSDIENRLDYLEGVLLPSVNQQIASVSVSITNLEALDEKFQQLVEALMNEVDSIQLLLDNDTIGNVEMMDSLIKEIADLKEFVEKIEEKDVDLDERITGLKAYVDKEIFGIKDWANVTFATLTQFDELQTEIVQIKNLIDQYKKEITAAYIEAIETAIAISEESIQKWVNTELQVVYAEIANVKIELEEAIKTTQGDLNAAVKAQQEALEQAKNELVNAYEQAIVDAINNGGRIDQAIAKTVASAQEDLQNQIDYITEELNSIKSRLEELEYDFANRIQSIRFLPEYGDGKVVLSSSESIVTLSFMLSPSELALAIADACNDSDSVVTAWISRTQSTRKADVPIALTVNAIDGFENGMFIVEVNVALLPEGYWDAYQSGNIFIRIQDGNNDIISEMIPVEYKK